MAEASAAVMKSTIVSLASIDFMAFDAFVAASPQCSPFATSAILRSVRDTLGIDVDVWIASREGSWLAVLPVFSHRRAFGRHAAVTPPLMAYTSLVCAPSVAGSTSREHDVVRAAAGDIASRYRNPRHQLAPSLSDVRPWQWTGWAATPAYTYLVDLTQESPLGRAVRQRVRKCAERGDVLSDEWNLERAWPPIESTMRRQGVGIGVTRNHFLSHATALHDAGLAQMYTALTAQGEVASVRIQLAVPGAGTAFDWVAGSDSQLLATGTSSWLVVQVMNDCRSRGYTTWDMCGASSESIAKFKSEFGGTLTHGFNVAAPLTLGAKALGTLRGPAVYLSRELRRRGLRR